MQHLQPQQLAEWLAGEDAKPQLIDVREPWEVATARIEGAVNIPMQQIPGRLNEIEDGPVVTICHHGMRSYQVGLFLENAGLGPVYNLTGGVDAWSLTVDPDVPRY